MWPYAADVEQPGRSIRINESVKTSSANPAGCTEPWSLSTAQRSVSPGKEILTRQPSVSQCLKASLYC
jgi:hypothetical protein